MKIANKIPYFIIAGFIYLLIYSSCANQGTPSGGPRDSIPPVLLRTEPEYRKINFKGDELRFTFDEYVVSDKIPEMLVISPPLSKRPIIKMKSKTLILEFNEELKDSVTYSVDFKNSIEDNNERNPLKDLRFSFSTWDVFDTLRIAGMVKNAKTLDPVEKALVMLYKNLEDSAVYKLIPDYIAKTNQKGIFMIDNIAPGKYHLFAINDANSDLKYNEGVEEIAYYDSLVIPEVRFIEEPDTIASGTDSLLISGHYQFSPEPFYLRQFTEDLFDQFLISSNRETKNKCRFIFEEAVDDTFGIVPLNFNLTDWYLSEPNTTNDTITLWVTDTLASKLDTMVLDLIYNQLDSTGMVYLKHDTVDMVFIEEKAEPERRRKRDREEGEDVKAPPIEQFSILDNIKGKGFDLFRSVILNVPQPVKHFNLDMVHLYLQEDTTGTPLSFEIQKDTTGWRKYRVDYKWEPNTEYRIEIDSAACENIYGITNRRFMKKFTTQKDDYYGTIILTTENVNGNIILQLVSNDDEKVISEKKIDSDGLVVFEFLAPEKYKLKAIYDNNNNGKWDTGSFIDKYQPEIIAYFQKVFKIKSNFDQKETWDLTPDYTFPKNIFDKDLEEKKKQEAKDKNKKSTQNTNSSGFGINSGSGGAGSILKRK
ncbi:MAG: Ig-like domain-containing protein [Prolixibacteraceae bacterium]|nr:Ig-like domain-containing protein [Prolixibacteraceae bacterium]